MREANTIQTRSLVVLCNAGQDSIDGSRVVFAVVLEPFAPVLASDRKTCACGSPDSHTFVGQIPRTLEPRATTTFTHRVLTPLLLYIPLDCLVRFTHSRPALPLLFLLQRIRSHVHKTVLGCTCLSFVYLADLSDVHGDAALRDARPY
jgi:hypothetical protein